ncbi:MAG: hypothetical protein ACOCWH_06960, partial [Spirochaetota bacterium]
MTRPKMILLALLLFLEAVILCGIFDLYPLDAIPVPVRQRRLLNGRVRSYAVTRDAFLYTKSLSAHVGVQMKKEYGWVLLDMLETEYGMEVDLYDSEGFRSTVPGSKDDRADPLAVSVLTGEKPVVQYDHKTRVVTAVLPVIGKRECVVCHRDVRAGSVAGAISFIEQTDLTPLLVCERK